MASLHIVQGDKDGDKRWLELAARRNLIAPSWIVPKRAQSGDDVVIYIGGHGFFATAKINSATWPRDDWTNRYSAQMRGIKLIPPAISLGIIQREIPELTWANYPRSITTPNAVIADQVRALVRQRRKSGMLHTDDESLVEWNLEELRSAALSRARPSATKRQRLANYRLRSRAIHQYVLTRSGGRCEACGSDAPFRRSDGSPYLEPHHTRRLADDGPDHPDKVIALCPNCHRRAHHGDDAQSFNRKLMQRLASIARRKP